MGFLKLPSEFSARAESRWTPQGSQAGLQVPGSVATCWVLFPGLPAEHLRACMSRGPICTLTARAVLGKTRLSWVLRCNPANLSPSHSSHSTLNLPPGETSAESQRSQGAFKGPPPTSTPPHRAPAWFRQVTPTLLSQWASTHPKSRSGH